VFFAALLLSTTLRGEGPTFLIERIEVRGAEYSSGAIVSAESRLREGNLYSEDQLRDAIARVKRLPFVVHADFRLEKGSERGSFVLVISIVETQPVFATFNSQQQWVDTIRPFAVIDDPLEPPTLEYREVTAHSDRTWGTVGGRWFAGSRGVAAVSADYVDCASCKSDLPRFSAGFTQYDLFGSRASLSAFVQYRNISFDMPESYEGDRGSTAGDHLAYQLTAAMPLLRHEALRATYYRESNPFAWSTTPSSSSPVRVEKRPYVQSEIAWLHDTTDDPRFPSSGTFARGAIETRRLNRIATGSDGRNHPFSENETDFRASFSRYRPVTARQSLSAGADYQSRAGQSLDDYTARLGYSADLWGRERTLKHGDLRFEASVDRVFMDYSVLTAYSNVRLGVAFRNQWGIATFTFQYVGWRDQP
jgi:hypothetical protein